MKLCIFTLALDAMPFLPTQLFTLSRLSFSVDWHWYVVHGAAANTGSTAWCQRQEPRLSVDGTTEFLRSLAGHPRITVIESKWFPGGKDQMVNEALSLILEPCTLVQIDSDEVWETWQIERISRMFEEQFSSNCARFDCVYYVGPNLVTTMRNVWGQRDGEFLRAFRFEPGMRMRHEPPALSGVNEPGKEVCLLNDFTFGQGLVFQHLAYAFEHQVAYKEKFYGYPGAVKGWRRLQQFKGPFPIPLKPFFYWADDGQMVDQLHK